MTTPTPDTTPVVPWHWHTTAAGLGWLAEIPDAGLFSGTLMLRLLPADREALTDACRAAVEQAKAAQREPLAECESSDELAAVTAARHRLDRARRAASDAAALGPCLLAEARAAIESGRDPADIEAKFASAQAAATLAVNRVAGLEAALARAKAAALTEARTILDRRQAERHERAVEDLHQAESAMAEVLPALLEAGRAYFSAYLAYQVASEATTSQLLDFQSRHDLRSPAPPAPAARHAPRPVPLATPEESRALQGASTG